MSREDRRELGRYSAELERVIREREWINLRERNRAESMRAAKGDKTAWRYPAIKWGSLGAIVLLYVLVAVWWW